MNSNRIKPLKARQEQILTLLKTMKDSWNKLAVMRKQSSNNQETLQTVERVQV